MRSEALDITIETRGKWLWVFLSGPFNNEQVPNIKEKITGLVEDGNRRLVIDLEEVNFMGEDTPLMFLTLLNNIRGKSGELRFVFKNDIVTTALLPYRNIFRIFPDEAALARGGFLGELLYQRRMLSRKTGVRLSRPVALFLLFVLCGWFLSMAFIVYLQNERIQEQETELSELSQWKFRNEMELKSLKERLRPLEQLGILRDSLEVDE